MEIEFGIDGISEVVPMGQLSNRMIFFEFGKVTRILEELQNFLFDLWNPNVGMCLSSLCSTSAFSSVQSELRSGSMMAAVLVWKQLDVAVFGWESSIGNFSKSEVRLECTCLIFSR